MPSTWLIDACCLLNLSASGHLEAVLAAWRPDESTIFCLAENVKKEALFLRRGGTGEDAEEHEAINLDTLLENGTFQIVRPDTEQELSDYVSLTAQLDDGEAMTCILAASRGWSVVTDDRKALRWLASQTVPALGTLYFLHQWANDSKTTPEDLKKVLLNVQDKAHFLPPRAHPLKTWWEDALAF